MKKGIYQIIILSFCISKTFAQNYINGKTDWESWGLRGHVSEMTEYIDTDLVVTDYKFTGEGKIQTISVYKRRKTRSLKDSSKKEFTSTTTKFMRDIDDRIASEIDGDGMPGFIKTYRYEKTNDSLKIIIVSNPPSGSIDCPIKDICTYNSQGQLIKLTMFACDTIAENYHAIYSYDQNGHLVEIRETDCPTSCLIVKFVNDIEGNPISSQTYSQNGQLQEGMNDTTSYVYDSNKNWILKIWNYKRRGKPITKKYQRKIIYY